METVTITFDLENASSIAKAELEKSIQQFIEEQTDFIYSRYTEDKKTNTKSHALESINIKAI